MCSDGKQKHPFKQLKTSIRELKGRHRERHRPTGFGFAFADSIDFLDAGHWDKVAGSSSFFLRRQVLKVIEEHGPENIQPRYAVVFDESKPVAALAAQIVSVRGQELKPTRNSERARQSQNLFSRVLRPALGVAAGVVKEKMLVAGNLLSWGFHGIAFSADEDPGRVWPGIAEALYRIRRAERLTGQTNLVMIKDVTSAQAGLERLRRFSYRPLETEPNMVLQIDSSWRSYDDYLGALDAKYRRNSKEQLKKLSAAGCVLERVDNLEPHAARLHELYLAVHQNASVRLVTLPEQFLFMLAREAGPDFRCTVIRRGDSILGFVTTIRDGDTALGYYIGFDRAAVAEGLPIYLRLLHATVADAIEWRCKRLSLGRTALEPKAALGAKPEEMSVWLRHRVAPMNWMLRALLGGIPHAEAPERNPFKARGSLVQTPATLPPPEQKAPVVSI